MLLLLGSAHRATIRARAITRAIDSHLSVQRILQTMSLMNLIDVGDDDHQARLAAENLFVVASARRPAALAHLVGAVCAV